MHWRSVTMALGAALLSAALAVGLFLQAGTLQREGEWLHARAGAQVDAYVRSLDGAHVDDQLRLMAERRDVLGRARGWESAAQAAFIGALALALGAYALFLRERLRAQCIDDGRGGGSLQEAPAAASSRSGAVHPALLHGS